MGGVEEYWIDADKVPLRALPGNLLERRGHIFLVTNLEPERHIIEAKELDQAIIRALTITKNTIEEKLSFTRHMKRCVLAGMVIQCGNAILECKPNTLVTVMKGRTTEKELNEEEQRKHTFTLSTHAISIRLTEDVPSRKRLSAPYWWFLLDILAKSIILECHRRYGFTPTQFGIKLHREAHRLIIYDRCVSIKATKTIFVDFSAILRGILEQLKECHCKSGCSRCIGTFYSQKKNRRLTYNPKQFCKLVVEGFV